MEIAPELLEYPDRVADKFTGMKIFITGGTGFLGKVLVEKFLRRCDGLEKIYMLVRSKKGKDANERLKEQFSGPLYDLVRKQKGDGIFKKCQAIPGDVSELNLGMSDEDRKFICQEANIIYHCAATVRFDEPLKKAVLLNTRGTKLMIELAQQCKNLKLFVHVSTAYAHLGEKIIYEKTYPPPTSPEHMIKTVEWMDEEIVNEITPKLLGHHPNTYSFSKALGEGIINEYLNKLPIILLRPSVVIPIWKDPLPGWTDNINGPTGLLIGAGKGVIRTMYCNQNGYADFVPVDITSNAVILCSYDYLEHGNRNVYNITSSSEYKVSWEEIIDIGRKVINEKMPLNGVVWYPGGSMKSNKLYHLFCFYMYQFLPAIFLDGILMLLGYKPLLVRIQKRIKNGYEVFEYYANNQWDFNNEESLQTRESLNPRERELYKIDGVGLDLEEYFLNCTHAARLYILKEPDNTIKGAKRHMMVMWCVDKICKALFWFGIAYFLYSRFISPLFQESS